MSYPENPDNKALTLYHPPLAKHMPYHPLVKRVEKILLVDQQLDDKNDESSNNGSNSTPNINKDECWDIRAILTWLFVIFWLTGATGVLAAICAFLFFGEEGALNMFYAIVLVGGLISVLATIFFSRRQIRQSASSLTFGRVLLTTIVVITIGILLWQIGQPNIQGRKSKHQLGELVLAGQISEHDAVTQFTERQGRQITSDYTVTVPPMPAGQYISVKVPSSGYIDWETNVAGIMASFNGQPEAEILPGVIDIYTGGPLRSFRVRSSIDSHIPLRIITTKDR